MRPRPAFFVCLGMHPVAGCGRILTDDERYYYGHSCEACTRAWNETIEAWRKGGENPELDKMFSAPKPIKQ